MALCSNCGLCTPVATQSLLQTQLKQSGVEKLSQAKASSASSVTYLPLIITVAGTTGAFLSLWRWGQSGKTVEHAKPRDASLDHVKWILSGLVTYGHITMYGNIECGGYWDDISKFWSHPAYRAYLLTHLFVMPSFCLMSGYFSQSYVKRQEESGVIQVSVPSTKLVGTVMNIFLMAELFAFWTKALGIALDASLTIGKRVETIFLDPFSFFDPADFNAWYIFALIIWRLLLPFWTCLRWGFACSFLIAVLSGLGGGLEKVGARTWGYFPFFMAGFMVDKAKFEACRKDKRSQIAALALFAMVCCLLGFRASTEFLKDIQQTTMAFDWRSAPFSYAHPAAYYSTTFACTAAAFSLAALVLDGTWGSVLDQMSTRSLYNYMGVGISTVLLNQCWDWEAYMNSLPPLGQMVFSMFVSFGMLMFNTCWPVWYVTSSLCEPNLKWLFKSSKSD